HRGWLILDIGTLTPGAALALAKHEGRLDFSGLKTLSDEAASALATHRGERNLFRLDTLSAKAAKMLRSNPDIWLPEKFR
ncbi:MAG: hypothetical protein WCJ31_21335, partial [Planctomycetia bacterium]